MPLLWGLSSGLFLECQPPGGRACRDHVSRPAGRCRRNHRPSRQVSTSSTTGAGDPQTRSRGLDKLDHRCGRPADNVTIPVVEPVETTQDNPRDAAIPVVEPVELTQADPRNPAAATTGRLTKSRQARPPCGRRRTGRVPPRWSAWGLASGAAGASERAPDGDDDEAGRAEEGQPLPRGEAHDQSDAENDEAVHPPDDGGTAAERVCRGFGHGPTVGESDSVRRDSRPMPRLEPLSPPPNNDLTVGWNRPYGVGHAS